MKRKPSKMYKKGERTIRSRKNRAWCAGSLSVALESRHASGVTVLCIASGRCSQCGAARRMGNESHCNVARRRVPDACDSRAKPPHATVTVCLAAARWMAKALLRKKKSGPRTM